MTIVQQTALCVFVVSGVQINNYITVQCTFSVQCAYDNEPQQADIIRRYEQFKRTNSVGLTEFPGCPSKSDEAVERLNVSVFKETPKYRLLDEVYSLESLDQQRGVVL